MSLDILKERGVPPERQQFTWRDIAPPPISKLDSDAFSRGRVILMNGIESESLRFQHACARMQGKLQRALAHVRRAEQHQQTTINWLLPADQSILETTIAYEQVAIEVTASLALHEPDPYLAQNMRFGLLEDFDHLYRYAALMDRVEGRDANNIVQSYSDIAPGRMTEVHHRHPDDDLRRAYDRRAAQPISKLNCYTIMAGEHQTHDYYMHVGPLYADPVARQVYAEIASVEEQHVTQYESLIDPDETWLEKWLLHEATEAYNYWSCLQYEGDARLKAIWERFLDYELGHMHFVMDLMREQERRDPAELLPATFPEAIEWSSHREFVRQVLRDEVDLRADGPDFVSKDAEPERSRRYREQMNTHGSPAMMASRGYRWEPGTELVAGRAADGGNGADIGGAS